MNFVYFFPSKRSKEFTDEFMVLKCQTAVMLDFFFLNQDDELYTIVVYRNAVLLRGILYFLSNSPLI